MKKLLVVCLMLFLNYSNSTAQNGNYHRLLEEDSKWRIGYASCGWYITDLKMSEYDTLMIDNSEWGNICDGFETTEMDNNSTSETNILQPNFEDLVEITPNPASIAWNIQMVQDIKTPSVLQLFDIKGQLLKSIAASNEQKIQIENEQLPAGIYFLKIMQNGKTLGSLKLQKQ